MPEVDDFVQDLIDEYKVFADGLLIDGAAEVLDDDHDPIEQFQEVGGRDVEPCRGHHVDRWLLEVGEVNALDVEDGLGVSFSQFDLAVEQLGRVLDQVRPKVSVDYRVASCRQEKYLWYHRNYIHPPNKYQPILTTSTS